MKLNGNDKKILETLFDMKGGYVLDFSDRTMSNFFEEELDIKIYDEKYDCDFTSKSKANRLRGIFLKEDEKIVGQIILALIDYLETNLLTENKEVPENTKNLIEKARGIGARLLFNEILNDQGTVPQGVTEKTAIIKSFNAVDFNTLQTNEKIYLLKVLYSYYEAVIRAYYGSGLFFLTSGIDDLNDYFKILRKRIMDLIASDDTFTDIKNNHSYEEVFEPLTSLYSGAEFLDVIWHESFVPSMLNMREDIADKDLFENQSEIHKMNASIPVFLEAISKEMEKMKKYLNEKTKSYYSTNIPNNKEPIMEKSSSKKIEDIIKHEHKHIFENSIQEKPIDLIFTEKNMSKPKSKNKFPFTIQSGTTWESIYIQFKNAEAVTIQVSGHTHDTSFADMGFADQRTGRPNMQWGLLIALARNGGSLSASDPDANDKYKKHKQLLSDNLKSYFSIDFDPFKPYEKDEGYVLKLNISYPKIEKEDDKEYNMSDEIENIFQDLTE